MDTKALMHADYLDILFDNRNKTYGGYELRKNYNQRVGKAVGGVVLLIVSLVMYGLLQKPALPPEDTKQKGPIVLTDFSKEIDVPMRPTEPPPPPKPKAKEKIFTDPVITNQIIPPDKEMTKNADLTNGTIGITNSIDTGDIGIGIGLPEQTASGNGKGGVGVIETKPEEPHHYVQQMPHFDGDVMAYLSRNVHYPDAARDAGIEGKVQVEFVVNENGTIGDAKIVRGIGGGCDMEALRVVKAMPKWKPGMHNGVAVKVYFVLPIMFVLQ